MSSEAPSSRLMPKAIWSARNGSGPTTHRCSRLAPCSKLRRRRRRADRWSRPRSFSPKISRVPNRSRRSHSSSLGRPRSAAGTCGKPRGSSSPRVSATLVGRRRASCSPGSISRRVASGRACPKPPSSAGSCPGRTGRSPRHSRATSRPPACRTPWERYSGRIPSYRTIYCRNLPGIRRTPTCC